MEAQITTIGTLLLVAFYAIGYVLNQQAKKHHEEVPSLDRFDLEQTEFLSILSSTASQSTSLNVLLWQRVMDLEDQQEENQCQLEMLKRSNQQTNPLSHNWISPNRYCQTKRVCCLNSYQRVLRGERAKSSSLNCREGLMRHAHVAHR